MTGSSGSAVQGASLLIILQIVSRAVTFVANQLLLRFLTAQLLGVSAQLEAYYLSVLFFARESLRVAIQRQGSTSEPFDEGKKGQKSFPSTDHAGSQESQAVVNVGHLALVLGLGTAISLGASYLHYANVAAAATPNLDRALYIYGLASIVELLSEPAFVVLQQRLRFAPRAAAESIATFIKCMVTFGTANWAWHTGQESGVLPFALGQLGYGVGLLGVYLWFGLSLASSEGFSLLPTRIAGNRRETGTHSSNYTLGYFYTPTLRLASSLWAQSFVKHILTQGDTLLVSIFLSTHWQGIYALANNYGSLLARLVFQPVEESSRNYFSKLLSSSSVATSKVDGRSDLIGPSKENLDRARKDIQALLKAYILLGILVVTLGPFGAPLLVQVIAGKDWAYAGAGSVLAQYCFYIPLLALNGISEAFVSSVATEAQVHRQSLWMGAFSITFATAGFVFLRVLDCGAAGLVYANAINMLCRIVWSGYYISLYFARNQVSFAWSDAMPTSLASYTVGTAVLWQVFLQVAGISAGHPSAHVYRDVAKVVVLALPYVAFMAYMERGLLVGSFKSLRRPIRS